MSGPTPGKSDWFGPSRIESWMGDDGAMNARIRLIEQDAHSMGQTRLEFLVAELEDIRQIFSEIKPGYVDADATEDVEPAALERGS